jgi:hypothetical protein
MFLGYLLENDERIAYNESEKITSCDAAVSFWESRKPRQFVRPVTFRSDGNAITATQGKPYEDKNAQMKRASRKSPQTEVSELYHQT